MALSSNSNEHELQVLWLQVKQIVLVDPPRLMADYRQIPLHRRLHGLMSRTMMSQWKLTAPLGAMIFLERTQFGVYAVLNYKNDRLTDFCEVVRIGFWQFA